MICDSCGAKLDDDAQFCTDCGAVVAADNDDEQAVADPEPRPEPEPEPAPAPEPAPTTEPEPAPVAEQPKRSRAPMIIIGISTAVILVCVGILLAFTVFKPRTYAVNLPVSIPGLDEAGSRVPVQAHRVDVQMGPTVHVYLSSTGDGLELEPGTWEIKPEGSPIAKDGTIYQYEVEPVTMQVDKADDDTATAKASEPLELAPVSPAFITDDQVSKAVEWAKGDKGRTVNSDKSCVEAVAVGELEGAIRTQQSNGKYDLALNNIAWVQKDNWTEDYGLIDLPNSGPFYGTTDSDPLKDSYNTKLSYALADVNKDGIDELFLRPSCVNRGSDYMMVYTIAGGKLTCVDKSPWYFESTRESRAVSNDGRLVSVSRGHVAFYEISDAKTVLKDSYDCDYGSQPVTATHNGAAISADEFTHASNFEPLSLEWKAVEDHHLMVPQSRDESSLSDLDKSRIKTLNEAMGQLFPSLDRITVTPWIAVKGGSDDAMSLKPEYTSHFEQDSLTFSHGSRNTGLQFVPKSFGSDPLLAVIGSDDFICYALACAKNVSFETSVVGDGLCRVTVVGDVDPAADASKYVPTDAQSFKIDLLVTFEGDSSLISGSAPLARHLISTSGREISM